MKKLLASVLIFLLAIPTVFGATSVKPDESINVFINGERVTFDVAPILMNNTTLVQFTPIFNKLGISYEWDGVNKIITGKKGEQTIKLEIDEPVVSVNEFNIKLSASPILYKDRTLVPLRFVGEATGMDVIWNKETKEIHINNSATPKSYEKPDYTVYTQGAAFGTTAVDFLKRIKVEPDKYDEKNSNYSFNKVKQFGYDSNLNVLFKEDAFNHLFYTFYASDLNKSVLLVYRDIVAELEKTFGAPNEFSVRAYTDGEYKILTTTISDQDLIRGLRNESHYVLSHWAFSELWVYATLINNGSEVTIQLRIQKPL